MFLQAAFTLSAQSMQQYLDSVMLYNQINPDKALNFGLDAIRKGYDEGPSLMLLKINTRVGQILSEQHIDGQAIRYLNESLVIFSGIPLDEREEKKVSFPPWVLVNIGNIYFRNENYLLAKENYLKALDNFKLFEDQEMKNYGLATVYDNLALISLSSKNFKTSEEYFNKASKIRGTLQKNEDLLYSKLGFLQLYIEMNNHKAVDNIFREICDFYRDKVKLISEKDVSSSFLTRNYGYALIRIGVYHMKLKKYDEALNYFENALDVLSSFKVELPIIETYLTEIHYLKNDLTRAKKSANVNINKLSKNNFNKLREKNLQILESIYTRQNKKDSLLIVKNSLISFYVNKEKNIINKEFSRLESYLLLAQKQQEMNEEKITYNTYVFILIIMCVVFVFLFISVRLNLNLQKAISQKAQIDKKLIQMELKNKNLALINKTKFISQQNTNLNYILESTRNKYYSQDKIEAKIETLLTNFRVNEKFEKQFDEVYPGYFNKLIKYSNKLTQNDLRLCAYIRLNQTTKEIAQMCGVSIRTIESQKYRLRKKLKLSKDQSLTTFLFSLDLM